MSKIIDIVGKKFGRLTVLGLSEKSTARRKYWICICECGNEKTVRSDGLKSGDSRSCGCLQKEVAAELKSVDIYVRLKKYIKIDQDSGSWIWTGCQYSNGYGLIGYNGKNVLIHRLIYELFVGSIPKNMCVCHINDVKLDISPQNLFLGTAQDNITDKVNKGRQARGEKHGNSKLTELKVLEIRSLYSMGNYSHRELGKMFGVDRVTVRGITTGKQWKHV